MTVAPAVEIGPIAASPIPTAPAGGSPGKASLSAVPGGGVQSPQGAAHAAAQTQSADWQSVLASLGMNAQTSALEKGSDTSLNLVGEAAEVDAAAEAGKTAATTAGGKTESTSSTAHHETRKHSNTAPSTDPSSASAPAGYAAQMAQIVTAPVVVPVPTAAASVPPKPAESDGAPAGKASAAAALPPATNLPVAGGVPLLAASTRDASAATAKAISTAEPPSTAASDAKISLHAPEVSSRQERPVSSMPSGILPGVAANPRPVATAPVESDALAAPGAPIQSAAVGIESVSRVGLQAAGAPAVRGRTVSTSAVTGQTQSNNLATPAASQSAVVAQSSSTPDSIGAASVAAGATHVDASHPVTGPATGHATAQTAVPQATAPLEHGATVPSHDVVSNAQAMPGGDTRGALSGSVSATQDSSGPGLHSTFAALDSAGSAVPATWTQANARSAEAGYQDPTLGWVAVRAQQDATGMHAILVPGSADAAQSLSAHMSGLNNFLTAHNSPVQTLSMGTPTGQDAAFTMSQGGGQSADQSANRDAGSSALHIPGESVPPSTLRSGDVSDAYRPAGGTYVSVMA